MRGRVGPYELLSPLGTGGSGEVYRARDRRLDRIVAIKVLRAETTLRPEARARFEREARAIASLNHPHICALYDIGHDDGVDFLVMQYLEGETLAARLVRGALPFDQALTHLIELASAIDVAHRQHVIHRDLKPSNIMLTKTGAVLLDFGLAKLRSAQRLDDAVDPGSSTQELTREGAVVGTVRYMAPEVVEGGEADARSDLFSLGAVAYEMTSGRRAFDGGSDARVMASILADAPPPITSIRPEVPSEFDSAIRTCLEKDAEARWQNAGDLVRHLRSIAATSPRTATSAIGGATSGRARLWRLWRLAALGAVLLLAATLAVAWLWVQTQPLVEVQIEPRWILVSAFDNRTGDSRLDDSLRVALEQELMQSRRLALVSEDRVNDTLRLMRRGPDTQLDAATAREVALRDGGISLVVSARVERLGSNYRLSIHVDDVHANKPVLRDSATAGEIDALLAEIARLAVRVRTSVGESQRQAEGDAPPARVTTRSLDALYAYTQGLALINEANWSAAELPLREAVRIDPEFASAHVMLAHVIWNQRRPETEYGPIIARAFELSEGLPPRERYFIVGSFYGMRGDHGKAIAAYEVLVREFPNDYWGVNNLGGMYARAGRITDAAVFAERRAGLRPNDFVLQIDAAAWLVATLGELTRARGMVENAMRLHAAGVAGTPSPRHLAWMKLFPVFDRWAEGQVAEAATILDAIRLEDTSEAVLVTKGLLEMTFGRLRAARAAFDRLSPASPLRQPLLAYLALARGATDEAVVALRADRRLFARSVTGQPAEIAWITLTGMTMVRAGLIEEAEAHASSIPMGAGTNDWWQGQLAAARGDVDAAIRFLEPVVPLFEPGRPITLMGATTLAEMYIRRRKLDRANALLRPFGRMRRAVYPLNTPSGFEWLRMRALAAAVQRRLGNHAEAEATEQELRNDLRFADPELVLVKQP